MRLKAVSKAGPLAALSATEMLAPFLRMIILAHVLGPYELGFAAALSAAYATVEQITDTGLFRFVLAAPRERYREALATAHGIALVRGVIVAGLFLAVAYPVSCGMVTCGDWPSFAWLAPLALLKSFENLELRVAERDYVYWRQLSASIASHLCGVATVLIVGLETGTHYALLGYLIVQLLVYTTLTHVLARTRFSCVVRGPLTRDALRFSLPLMLNGAGNAVMAQGDRFFVGAFLGLQALGVYAVMILTAYVPTAGLFRLLGPILFAGLINSTDRPAIHAARLKLYSRAVPLIAAIYALGWILLGKNLIPAIFGSRFVISDAEMLLVGLIVYFRICRGEPATALLLMSHGTRRLALANQVPLVGLMLGALLTWFRPSFESLLIGSAFGEVMALSAMLFSARQVWRPALGEAVRWCAVMSLFPATVGGMFFLTGPADHIVMRAAVGLAALAAFGMIAWFGLRPLIREGYRSPAVAGVPLALQQVE